MQYQAGITALDKDDLEMIMILKNDEIIVYIIKYSGIQGCAWRALARESVKHSLILIKQIVQLFICLLNLTKYSLILIKKPLFFVQLFMNTNKNLSNFSLNTNKQKTFLNIRRHLRTRVTRPLAWICPSIPLTRLISWCWLKSGNSLCLRSQGLQRSSRKCRRFNPPKIY